MDKWYNMLISARYSLESSSKASSVNPMLNGNSACYAFLNVIVLIH
ncbi:7836_t:CDS:2 [Acaulospora morrowiae]|uniref:7836_t:CDS:1 n=1 Tax=Acaulospora morrowiae TaxID=94023 RepID=A0A9N8Z100_9GLOM|nr:7836_t:CDS:2 [Acaulospora morrowiae]